MNRNLVLLGICLLAVSFVGETFGQKKKPRIGIAGIQIENSVFVPNRQPLVGHPVRMPDYLSPDSAMGQAATWLPTQIGYGGGRGPVTKESYDAFVEKTLEMIKANMPYDAFWFYNHGACSVEGVADPEGEFMEKVRSLIGNDVLTTTTMDLHGNTSWLVALNSDLITTYRQAPHADSRESHRRGVVNLLERLESGKGRPAYKAWVAVPVLVSGEWSSTRVEPAKSLYALVPEVEAMPGVIDAGIWIGYVWGDNPRNQGTVMVYGDDEEQVKAGAKKLAQKFWDVHKQFSLEAPGYSLEKCIDLAVASKKKPFFISDMDDLERDTMFLRHLLHPWYPIIGVGTLIGVIQNKTVIFNRRMLRTFPELWHLCGRFHGKVHEIDPAVGYVCHTEPLVSKKFRISEKFPLPTLCTQNTNTFLPLRPGITDARLQQII